MHAQNIKDPQSPKEHHIHNIEDRAMKPNLRTRTLELNKMKTEESSLKTT